jgi:hypothetical protein
LEENKAALEQTVRDLQNRLKNQPHAQLHSSSPLLPKRQLGCQDSQGALDAFAEQIAKLLFDPSGHARTFLL